MKKIFVSVIVLLGSASLAQAATYATREGTQTFSGGNSFTGSTTFYGAVKINGPLNISTETAGTLTVSSLNVTGQITMNGNAGTAGQVLQSNGAGALASWATAATTTSIANSTLTFQVSSQINIPISQMSYSSGAGYGSINTKVRHFTTRRVSTGTAVVCTDSAVMGTSCTVTIDGWYDVFYQDQFTAAQQIGIVKNGTQGTTIVQSTAEGNLVAGGGTPGANLCGSARAKVYMKANRDYVWAQAEGAGIGGTTRCVSFSVAGPLPANATP